MSGHLHQKTGLTAGTIANDDELATDLGHLDQNPKSVSTDSNRIEEYRSPRSENS